MIVSFETFKARITGVRLGPVASQALSLIISVSQAGNARPLYQEQKGYGKTSVINYFGIQSQGTLGTNCFAMASTEVGLK